MLKCVETKPSFVSDAVDSVSPAKGLPAAMLMDNSDRTKLVLESLRNEH